MTLFKKTPLFESVNVRVDSDPGSSNEVERKHINYEEGESMQVNVESLEQNTKSAGKDPKEGKGEPMVLEKLIVIDQGSDLADVLHF